MTADSEVRQAAELLQKAWEEDYKLPALTSTHLAQLMTTSIAAAAARSGQRPSVIAAEITDEHWPESLVDKEQP